MTARSFTEAFERRTDEAIRDGLPAHYFDCDKFRTYGYMNHNGDCDCTATADFESLLEKLDGAIRWAVTLEGQNAAMEAKFAEMQRELDNLRDDLERAEAELLERSNGGTE